MIYLKSIVDNYLYGTIILLLNTSELNNKIIAVFTTIYFID
jgi:hypothetical protein